MELDTENLCRICLKDASEFVPILGYEINSIPVVDIIRRVCCIQIHFCEKNWPQKLCDECLDTLRRAQNLNDAAIESELHLSKLFPTTKLNVEIMVKEEKIDVETKFKLEEEDYELLDDYPVSVKCDEDTIEPEIDMNDEDDDDGVSSDEPEVKKKKKRTPGKRHRCETCEKTFEKPSKLARHVKTHDVNKKPFACEFKGCFQRFQTDASLKRHGILHSGMTIKVSEEKSYQCVVCSKLFPVQEALASHMRVHKDVMETLEFPCPLCSEVFKKMNDLTRHSRKHPENKCHKCLICSKMFSQGSHLIDHLNRHNNLRPHVCHVCNKAFQQSSTLKDHLRTHTSEKPFLCSECGKSFNNPSNLRQHVKRHLNLKEFACHLCPGKFSCKASLESHIRSHSGIKPHQCTQCGSSFTKGSSLKKHVRTIHEGIKPFECEACSMRFNSSEHLKRHFRTHTGEKPYICDFEGCTRAYAQSNDLLKHKKSHVGELVYKCTICPDAFRLQSQLRDHYKVHYKNDTEESVANIFVTQSKPE